MALSLTSQTIRSLRISNTQTMDRQKEDIVITGISGRFPQSDNIWAFREHLINGDDLVTENNSRWPPGLWGLPRRSGNMKDISKFDANFFGVHSKQAHAMAPQLRILLEVSFEAIFDSGFHPESLRGSNTGVFIGVSTVDSEDALNTDPESINGYEVTGFYRCMFSNRISFTFDFKGPSITVDTGCSSSLTALNQALRAIQNGDCDACIVGGSNLCVNPLISLKFQRLGFLSDDGKCKSFDSDANGYVRSEAIVALFLQRVSKARRIYATVLHCKLNNDGFKEEGQTYPSGKMQEELLRKVYSEVGIDPCDVVYVEADGCGTKAGDSEEMKALVNVFSEKRKWPLLVGSVKSNMGHAEGCSGLCSIVKVLVSCEIGFLVPNLHLKNVILELSCDKLKIVTKKTEFSGGIIGINSIGFGGLNAHLILRCYPKTKQINYIDELHIFISTGRTEQWVESTLSLIQRKNNRDLFNLLLDSTEKKNRNFPYRGYVILNSKNSIAKMKEIPAEKAQIWFVFSGFGSQWIGMGIELMRIDIFKKSIFKSDEILKKMDVNLRNLILNSTKETMNNLTNAYVTIAAIQIALVDLLKFIGIESDGLIGHSFGETTCAYADGCLTHEQCILAAYWRGKCILDANSPKGTMAVVVGLTWDEARELCPAPSVEAVCHNTEKSVTIGGDKKSMRVFMKELAEKKIFVRELNTLNVAFHGKLIEDAAPLFLGEMKKIITHPKPRSPKWLSTSIPEPHWDSSDSKLASPEYFVNNLTNPVLFHDAINKIPSKSIIIEIAPHALLSPLLHQSQRDKYIFVSFARRTEPNQLEFFYRNIGKLFINGVNCTLSKLWTLPRYPVPFGTPCISPLVSWDHSDNWTTTKSYQFLDTKSVEGTSFAVNISSHESHDFYLIGHVIDGQLVYPIAGYLVFAWKAIANVKRKFYDKISVVLTDVMIRSHVYVTKYEPVKFWVNVSEPDETFAIREKNVVVCTGRFKVSDSFFRHDKMSVNPLIADTNFLNSKEVYKKLSLRGYDYGPTFQGIVNAKIDGSTGSLKWVGNWVLFIDAMMQFAILNDGSDNHLRFLHIGRVKIDPQIHLNQKYRNFSVNFDPILKKFVSGGIEMDGIETKIVRRQDVDPILEEFRFVSYFDDRCFEPWPYLENEISDYYLSCIDLIRTGLVKWQQNSSEKSPKLDEILEQISDIPKSDISDIPEYPMAKILTEVLVVPTKSDEETKNLIDNLISDATNDICIDSYLRPEFIKPLLDIVCDNTTSKNIIVTELNAKTSRTARQMTKLMRNRTTINVDYVVTAPTRDDLPPVDPTIFFVDTWDVEKSQLSNPTDLVVARNLLNTNLDRSQIILKNLWNSLKNDGFVLLLELRANDPIVKFIGFVGGFEVNDKDHLVMLMEIVGFKVIAIRSDGFLNDAFLIRKTKYKESSVLRIDESNYDLWVNELKAQIRQSDTTLNDTTTWLVSNDQPHCGILGLVEHLRRTGTGNSIRCIFNSSFTESKSCVDIAKDILIKDLFVNVYRDQKWGFFSSLPITPLSDTIPTKHAYVRQKTPGDLSSLKWYESDTKFNETSPNFVYVHYTTVNRRDVMVASDKSDSSYRFGMEFSGVNKIGQRVMGVLSDSAMATSIEYDYELSWVVPDEWSLREAATVPLVYTTVVYAMVVRGGMGKGESVLIHSASGGVGQAAIRVALDYGCAVYATVGSDAKRKLLMKLFPVLKDENFAWSTDTTFEEHVMRATNGRGVDIVLNSLSDDKLDSSIRCLSYGGRFLEIGNINTSENRLLGMSVFTKNISFHGIYIDGLFDKLNSDTKKKVANIVQEGLDTRKFVPLDTTIFYEDQLEDAFRLVASGKHFGKVLIQLRQESDKFDTQTFVSAHPNFHCHPSKSYVVIDGTTALGVRLGSWLVEKGAKFVFLATRTNFDNKNVESNLKKWRKNGVDVRISVKNFITSQGTKELLKEAIETQGAVGAIFVVVATPTNVEMDDSTTSEKLKSVYDTKICAVRNLDSASRSLCPSLDYFVVFGNRQSDFGDSTTERICEHRKFDEFPALFVRWGNLENVELAISDKKNSVLRISSAFSTLETFLRRDEPVVSSFVLPTIEQVESKPEVEVKSLVDVVSDILGISDTKSLLSDSSMVDLGVDSIVAVEIRQMLESSFNLSLSNEEIRRLTVGQLRNIGERKPSETFSNSKLWNVVNVINYDLQELIPTECLVKLNSIDSCKCRPLFVVHSIEGNVTLFKQLARQLTVPVYGFQLTPDVPKDDVTQLALYYIHEMQKIQQSPPYNLAGYCVGCVILFEMALQLQNLYYALDAMRSLMFLDGAHRPVSVPFLQFPDQFQESILTDFVFRFTQIDSAQVKWNLRNLPSLTSKMEFVVDTIMNLGLSVKRDTIKTTAQMFYACAELVRDYKPKEKLKSPVILLRATNNDFVVDKLGIDYSLGKVCRAPVTVEIIDGEHETFLKDPSADRLVRFLNRLLT